MHKKVWKSFWRSCKLPQAHEKVCDENETRKWRTRKTVIYRRKHFIGHMLKTGENVLDKLQVNNSGHNEGAICLINRRICVRGWFFEHGCTNECH